MTAVGWLFRHPALTVAAAVVAGGVVAGLVGFCLNGLDDVTIGRLTT